MMWASLASDVRYAARALRKRPLFLIVAVLSLSIGVGLNIGLYAVLRHVLFDSSLTSTPERFVSIEPSIAFPDYQDLRGINLPIDLVAMQMGALTWQIGDEVRTISAHIVSDNFFEALGVKAVAGRAFGPADVERADVVVLSFAFWRRTFAGDPTAIGRTLQLNGWPYTIVGVLPNEFAANPLMAGVVYVPIGAHVSVALENRRAAQFDLIGRLHDGVQAGQARAALQSAAVHQDGASSAPAAQRAREWRFTSLDAFSVLRQAPAGRIVLAAAATLYGLVGLVLLAAGANIAGLILARTDERRREFAVRMALGATRARLVRHVFIETLIVGAFACAAGVGLWLATASLLRRAAASAAIDVSALAVPVPVGYWTLLIVAVGATCGLPSAARVWRVSGTEHHQARLGAGITRRLRLQRALVAAQIAVCFVLLVAAAFFLDNIVRLRLGDPGFDAAQLLSATVRVPPGSPGRDQLAIRTALEEDPSVESVSWGSPIGPPFTELLEMLSSPGTGVRVDIRTVGPRFFETMRMSMVRGRDLLDGDLTTRDPRGVVVNEAFARRVAAGGDALGARFLRPRNPDSGRPQQVLQVVGIARDSMARAIGESRVPVVYVPQPETSFAIRLRQADASTVHRLQERIKELEPPGSVVGMAFLSDEVVAAVRPVRIATGLLATLAAIGLVLASTGLYAVVKYVATQRTFEIGVRIALGATRAAILKMMLRDGIRVIGIGCVCGVVVSYLAARVVETVMAGQAVAGPAVFLIVAAVLLVVGIAATFQPAREAAGADPIQALRYD